MTDEKIIQLYFNRDEKAIEETSIKYGSYCDKIANNILRNRQDSEECLNDTWMQTWDSIPPTHPVHFNLFLAKIVRNLSFNKYRNKYTQKRGRGEIALVLEELEECLAGHSDVEQLEKSMGKEVEANEETYYVSGHNDLQYIIRKTAGTYLLWKFMYFESDEYPFKDVLSLIYDVHSEQDIKEVYVKPSDVDNTDEGKALQLEIGNVSITDSDSITSLYKVLNSLTCYGPENWDRINYGQDDGGMLNAVRNGRYLTFSMANGCKLDSLKYTAVSGTFYEYGGVAYNELRKEQKDVIEEILNIDCSISEQQETEQRVSESEVNTEIQDAPADESTYQEARDYSAELTDLQNRITQAMINKELPFVTSCGIYENPDRVKAVVNTEDEDLLAKLRAFDTTGELLEIVYSSRANGLE